LIDLNYFLGNKNFLQKKYNDAIHCYNQALKQNGEKATYYVNRALCYIKLKQWDKVYQDARHALDLDPNYIKAHAYLGQYYIEQQRYDEAIICFKQALELCKVCFRTKNLDLFFFLNRFRIKILVMKFKDFYVMLKNVVFLLWNKNVLKMK
jgi:tetratricopeptide (TPR) repeat protein